MLQPTRVNRLHLIRAHREEVFAQECIQQHLKNLIQQCVRLLG